MSRIEEKDRLYGKLIVDFANAKTDEDAVSRLIENIQKAFDFSNKFIKSEKNKIFNPEISQAEPSWYTEDRRVLRIFINEFINQKRNLYKTLSFIPYLIDYNRLKKPVLIIDMDGSLIDEPIFEEYQFDEWRYSDIIAYCVVCFFKSTKNIKRIYKCDRCEIFYISTKIDKRNRYCPSCSPKSKMTREERRKYMKRYRDDKKSGKENEIVLLKKMHIRKLIKKGLTEKEAEREWKIYRGKVKL